MILGTSVPASEMTSSTVLTGRAEVSVELSRYISCGVAIIIHLYSTPRSSVLCSMNL